MIKQVYYDEKNYVTFDIPDSGNVACFMSGGADSSLMCYILAATIKEHGLKTRVYPITAEMLMRPYNLKLAYDVVEKVQELTGFKFDHHLCYIIPNHNSKITDEDKVEIHRSYTTAYMEQFNIPVLFNGLTANPPIEVVPDGERAERQKCRDDLEWRKKQESKPSLRVPFIHVDKKVVGQLYSKLGLMQSLFPMTRSCEAEMDETENFSKTCLEVRAQDEHCWWCKEREYGFREFL